MASRIDISHDHLRRIETFAREAWPYECCGLLVGVVVEGAALATKVTRVEPSRNLAAPEARDRFEIDPVLQFSLMRELRGGQEAIIGVYHSHPNGRALPSARDLADARDSDLVWLITALPEGGKPETRAFRLAPDCSRFDEIEIGLTDGP